MPKPVTRKPPQPANDDVDHSAAFESHGVPLAPVAGSTQLQGDCPLCGRSGRLFVNRMTGQWDCKKCGESGNLVVFLRKLYATLAVATKYESGPLIALANNRKLSAESLYSWGARYNPVTRQVVVPGYTSDGKLCQLYRVIPQGSKRTLLATKGLGHGLFMPTILAAKLAKGGNLKGRTVWLTEGLWDGAAVDTALRSHKVVGDKLAPTGNPKASLAVGTAVIGIPGANVWQAGWGKLLGGCTVVLAYDNDHPRQHPTTGNPVCPVGMAGARRVVQALAVKAEQPVRAVQFVRWGDGGDGFDGWSSELPDGYDLRDALADVAPAVALQRLIERVDNVPTDWLPTTTQKSSNGKPDTGVGLEPLPCDDWRTVVMAWRKAMKWTPGLDRALAVMLACVASTRSIGDQLWVKVIGPASCGKSTLCEAVSANRNHVLAKSTIRGFHSGYRGDGDGDDNSLVSQLYNRTLVTKDGDTLLQSPNLGQILSEGRDLYDGVSRTHYRNRVSNTYEGLRMTWILCGTSSLRSIDSSELGERFLDCVIMEGIDDDLEDEILWRVVRRSARNLGQVSTDEHTTQHDPDMVRAMQLTAGYVDYLSNNARTLVMSVREDDQALTKLIQCAKFVAYMRARPSRLQEEVAEREFAARLVSQHVRLAKFMAVVLGQTALTDDVLERVRQVSLDTSRGRTMQICDYLYSLGLDGAETKAVALTTNDTDENTRKLLRFLKRIGAVVLVETKMKGRAARMRWQLSPRMRGLYAKVRYSTEHGGE